MSFQTQSQNSINHFSHPHTLHLSNIQNNQSFSCSGCKLSATGGSGGLIYTCTCCNYFLHIECSQMPQQITHPFHKDHVFSLVPIPQYEAGYFNCDACGKPGQGFSYHCKSCSLDLHIFCVSMPLSINHQSHFHTLNLTFSPPFPIFNCDVCNNLGSNHWLYRCEICQFDAHLDCASINDEPNMDQHVITTQFQQPCLVSSSAPPQTFYQPISMIQEPATGIPIQQFVSNQGIQGINGDTHEYIYTLVQQLLARQESYNQNYMQAARGNGVNLGGEAGGIGTGGFARLGRDGVLLLIQTLTGLPIDARSLSQVKSMLGGLRRALSRSGGGGSAIGNGTGSLDPLVGGGNFQQVDSLGGRGGYGY